MQKLSSPHLFLYTFVKPRVSQSFSDILKSDSIWCKNLLNEFRISISLSSTLSDHISVNLSKFRSEMPVKILCLCQLLICTSCHIRIFTPLFFVIYQLFRLLKDLFLHLWNLLRLICSRVVWNYIIVFFQQIWNINQFILKLIIIIVFIVYFLLLNIGRWFDILVLAVFYQNF